LLAALHGDEPSACALAGSLAALLQEAVLGQDGVAAFDAIIRAMATVPYESVRCACIDTLSRLYWRADDPAGAPNLSHAQRMVRTFCQRLDVEDAEKVCICLLRGLGIHGCADYQLVKPTLEHWSESEQGNIAAAARAAREDLESI
jgi:hypothetical protein